MARKSDKGDQDQPKSADIPLTGHTVEANVVKDERTGKVQSAHSTTVITDPESDLAVQIPEGANDASGADPLAVHNEPTPEEAFESGDAPETPAADTDEAARSGSPSSD